MGDFMKVYKWTIKVVTRYDISYIRGVVIADNKKEAEEKVHQKYNNDVCGYPDVEEIKDDVYEF